MMEVNQPIGTGVLEMQKISSTSSVVVGSAESLQDISPEVKQNGIGIATDKTLSEVTMDIDETKCRLLEDEDVMERLTYGELDDGDDDDQLPATEINPNQTKMAQTISDTLIDDIIQLNKNTDGNNDDTDRLGTVGNPKKSPPSTVQSQSERKDTNTNGVATVEEDIDSSLELNDLPSLANEENDSDEEENLLLLEEDDDVEMEESHDVDENLLLDDGDAEEQDGSTRESAIQIEDSVVTTEIADATEITEGSIVAIDESGLSILNTAAVDIGDVTADESTRIIEDKDQELSVTEQTLEEDTLVAKDTEQAPLPSPTVQVEEPPVFALVEEMVTTMADNLKPTNSEDDLSERMEAEDNFATPQLSLSDLIKFPDVDNIVADSKQKDQPDCADETLSSESLLLKSSEESITLEEKELSEEVSITKLVEAEESDLNNAPIVTEEGGSNQPDDDDDEPELSDLIKFNDGPVFEKAQNEALSNEQPETTDIPEAPREGEPESVEDDTAAAEETENTESVDDEAKKQCRQALQAADEEDLLEMMDEPEQMEADDENGEEDLDDHSSESGSAKQAQADDEDDFEGSDCTAIEEDEASRNTEDHEEVATGVVDVVESEGEPPSKRKCSVDVREVLESENEKESKATNDKPSTQDKTTEKYVEITVKATEEGDPKSEVTEIVDEENAMNEADVKNTEQSTSVVEKSNDKEVPDLLEVKEASVTTAQSEESKETVAQTDTEMDRAESVTEDKDEEIANDDDNLDKVQKDSHETESVKVQEVQPSETIDVDKPEPATEQKNSEIQESEEVSAEDALSISTEKPAVSSNTEVVELSEKEEQVAKVETTTLKDESHGSGVKDKVVPSETAAADAAQDEVLIIDDDDDVPEKNDEVVKMDTDLSEQVKEDSTAVSTGKRPCPEDESEEKEDAESAKKMRLSTENKVEVVKLEGNETAAEEEIKSETVQEEKKEVKAEQKEVKEEKKSALAVIDPLKIVLNPEPVEPSKEKKPIRLDFLEKFKKPLEKMNRSDLEEFVLQKIVESIAFKSTIAEMRTQLDGQDALLLGYRQKVHDLNKQFKDLEMVHERVVKDLEKKNQHFVTPVKITRAVGLQVSQPRFVPGNRPSVGNAAAGTNSPKGPVNRSPVVTPAVSPNRNTPQANAQNRRPNFARGPPVVIKASPQQIPVNRSTQSTSLIKTSLVSSPATPSSNKTITPQQSPVTNSSSPQQQPSTPGSGAVPPLNRKKPLQKFTPMRPPLSITQQVQQQQQTRQMQEQLMRQQIQDVQTGTSNSSSGTGSQPQSPVTQSPQGSPLTRTPEPASSPLGRIPPIVMKKVTPQAKGTPTTMQIINRQTPSMVTGVSPANVRTVQAATSVSTPSTPTIDNSLIDLTDEDDAPKIPVASSAVSAQSAAVVPKPPITILNGQQQNYGQRQNSSMPPLVVINQQRVVNRTVLQQRSMGGTQTGGMVNGIGTPTRPMLIQRPGTAANGFTRSIAGQQSYKPRMANGQIDGNRRMVARATIRQQSPANTHFTHPAPLPQPGIQVTNPTWKQAPPRPSIRINNIETGIVISWTMDDLAEIHATIVSYQIYAYQETTAPPSMDMWRHVGDVKAMLLPMAVTLTQFQEGQRYHFAVRAVDEHQRVGQFSPPRTWNESSPGKVA
ncbi:activating transcription factor 7-interacting protein 1 [Malaya genurostris]|uniref:activating transcription factor 7-interacting protein 1 n=1 Tax=Malaya genurostris TaxID=325434 RepID=UPI0026F3B753|nr:activating transcription factor 7-interacting protein 1 [Malaya genurostris]XP_058456498.1 activating transcription factor 7-interacting protein 1 [Malaya genurostris]XP_058456499.1 activating transcription factor 7-interacting protein 1 [Malaya genurostris]XP_058456500.1 activating transcription factor 7-interacting protein 1 [Malaya genurostris]XP_058456502.1 activating transcription factor 7-interacting protein 1 [Malaya genurostris]XP_058456503.1 activating transcription factor 7-intera